MTIPVVSTCDVYAVTQTKTSTGGYADTEVIKHEDVPCTIEIARPTFERDLLGREGVMITHFIYIPSGYEDIVEKDVIKSGSRVYDINTMDNVQERNHHLEISAVVRE